MGSYPLIIPLLLVSICVFFPVTSGHFVPGPSCTVTSMIPGQPQPVTTSMEGTCQSIISCRGSSGVPIGKCGLTNVCCVFPRSCDSRTNQNQTYFTNPGYPSPYNGSLACSIDIYRVMTPYRICQIRLDFVDFELNPPQEGDCIRDRFVVSGQNSNSVIPAICGRNRGQHMYMDVDGAQGPFTLRILLSGVGYRRWNIKITQIECANPSRAPSNCLQYYTGPSGIFQSFNYESTRSNLELQALYGNPSLVKEASYFNNMDYAVCFRKEVGFCTLTYQVNTTFVPMEINAQSPSGTQVVDSKNYGAAGINKCVYDYIVLDGVRYCGGRLNGQTLSGQDVSIDGPVYDRGSGPFIAKFISNERYVGRGFSIGYAQNPCGARIPPNEPLNVNG